MIPRVTGFRLPSLRLPALVLGLLAFCTSLRAAESTSAGTADIDYVRRILLPAGHATGIAYTAQPSAPAFYMTRSGFYSLDLETGTFSPLTIFAQTFFQSATATYTSSVNGNAGFLHFANGTALWHYDLTSKVFLQEGTGQLNRGVFGEGANTVYATTLTDLLSYTFSGGSANAYGSPTVLYSGNPMGPVQIANGVATLLTYSSQDGQGNNVTQVNLATGTSTSFSIAEPIRDSNNRVSLTLDSEGNIYIGNQLGGAYVYNSSGQLLNSFSPGANNPTDANLGTNVPYLSINTAGDLVVMDATGMHQYRVFTPVAVTSLADSGEGTLRQAISDVVNGVRSARNAKFSSAFDTPQTIMLTSSLETLDDAAGTFSLSPQSLLTVDSGANTFLDLAGSSLVYSLANIHSVSTAADAIKVRDGAILAAADTFAFDHLTLAAGTLRSSGTFASSGQIALGAGGGTFDVAAGAATLGGEISGDAVLTKAGAGTLTLSGTNTHTGGTRFEAGIVSITNASALGSGGLVFDGGTLSSTTGLILNKDTLLAAGGGMVAISNGYLTLNGNVTGPGGLTKNGTSILTLNGAHTYAGLTAVNGGILKFGANGATASAVATSGLAIASGAKVIFADSQTYAGSVTGAGVLEHEFSGTTVFTGTATHTGGTNIIGGTIQVGNGGTTGSLAGNVTLSGGGKLAFNRSDDFAFGGVISGTGGVIQLGSGAVILLADSSYKGATTITAGQFLVEGNLTGAGLVDVTGGAIGGDGEIGGSLHFGLSAGIVFDPTKTLTIDGATVTFDGFSMADVVGLDSSIALGTYTLLDGPAVFDFTNVSNFGAANAYALGNGKFAYFQSGSLEVVVVPEPATWVLIALGAGVCARRRRLSL